MLDVTISWKFLKTRSYQTGTYTSWGTCHLHQKKGTSSATQRHRSTTATIGRDEQGAGPSHSGTAAHILYACKEDPYRTSPQNPRQPSLDESAQGRSPKSESYSKPHRTKHSSERWLRATSQFTHTAAVLFILIVGSIDREEIQAFSAQPSNLPAADANPECFPQLFFFFFALR